MIATRARERQRDRALDRGALERLSEASDLAGRMPDLLLESRIVANTVAHGLHGRRRSGPGESFWQFRHFQQGEPAKRIDWRRSARDENLYVREREWEAAHTLWLSIDQSPSMYFASNLAQRAKIDRAVVLALALGDLAVRGAERVGLVGRFNPTAQRQVAERAAEAISRDADARAGSSLPAPTGMGRFSDLVVFSDLLDTVVDIETSATAIASAGVRGHVVMIVDPVEETFPFDGRIEFADPETSMKLVLGKSEAIRDAYVARMQERRARIAAICQRLDWSFTVHHTDRPAAECLLGLHERLTHGHAGVAA
ncbi:DUF58 domain-containing protein [Tepidamorphus sp. 3E244]|uniref:DUF58 domain-containing protein n=1 Tax=Tepidamorphus sp. 3E244 TaxID=3385498 RepID=UPI0038FC4738